MASTLPERFNATPRKISSLRGETLGKKVPVGKFIRRALAIAGIEPKDAADSMGYASESHLNQWMADAENPHFGKLFALPRFRPAFIVALAEEDGGVEVRVTLPRREGVA